MIDVAMTACVRPEIHDRVFSSLKRNLRTSHKLRLIMNIDKIGLDISRREVMGRAIVHFDNAALVKLPAEPSFFHALKTVWSSVRTNYILQWEDDWELLHPIDLDLCIDLLETDPQVALVGFAKANDSIESRFSFGGTEFGVRKITGPHYHPSIMRWEYIQGHLERMSKAPWSDDPAKIVRDDPEFMEYVKSWQQITLLGPDNEVLVQDLGRDWMKRTGIKLKRG